MRPATVTHVHHFWYMILEGVDVLNMFARYGKWNFCDTLEWKSLTVLLLTHCDRSTLPRARGTRYEEENLRRVIRACYRCQRRDTRAQMHEKGKI